MELNIEKTLPDELAERAIRAFKHNHATTTEEEMMIRQWEHANEYGAHKITTEKTNEYFNPTLHINNKSYTRNIPLQHDQIKQEIYPIGDVIFNNIQLVAVVTATGFPWTTEAFNAWYFGEPDRETISVDDDHEREFFSRYRLMQQYFPPRQVTSQPPPCTVVEGDNPADAEFMCTTIRKSTRKRPNPWAYAAHSVLYENEELGNKILTDDSISGNEDEFRLINHS